MDSLGERNLKALEKLVSTRFSRPVGSFSLEWYPKAELRTVRRIEQEEDMNFLLSQPQAREPIVLWSAYMPNFSWKLPPGFKPMLMQFVCCLAFFAAMFSDTNMLLWLCKAALMLLCFVGFVLFRQPNRTKLTI